MKLNSLILTKKSYKERLENSLEIDSTQIKLLNINGMTSYTFRLITPNLENGEFDNLVIQTDSLQNTKAYYIKYFPLDENYNNLSDYFYGTKKIYVLDEAQTNLNNRTLDCYTFLSITDFYTCPNGVDQNPENCTYTHTGIVTNYTCDFTDEPIAIIPTHLYLLL